MELLFWICLAGLVWPFAGYPALMIARASRAAPWNGTGAAPHRGTAARNPTVSVVLAARNAEAALPPRVANLLEQDYPAILEVLVVCNGCVDGSEEVVRQLALTDSRVRLLASPPEEGKAGALNLGAEHAAGEILVFADVQQRFHRSAVRRLVRAFRDSGVGAVTGRLLIGRSDRPVVAGVGRYWEIETRLRLAESRTGSVVGATGAIYAVRRTLFRRIPPALILDDVWVPMSVAMQGYRVVMAPRAMAFDEPTRGYRSEYRRRVRTLLGNVELLRRMPGLLSPRRNPILGRYVSHKLLRLATPVLAIGLVIAGLTAGGPGYTAVAGMLLATYALGAIGLVVPARPLALPAAFVLLHTAGIAALLRPGRGAADVWAPPAQSGSIRRDTR